MRLIRPAKMESIAVVSARDDLPKVLSVLHDMGAVQVEPLDKDTLELVRGETDNLTVHEVSEELLRVRALKSALRGAPAAEKRRFSSVGELLQVSRSIGIDADVASLQQRREKALSELDQTVDRASLVERLSFVDDDLAILNLESAATFYGRMTPEACSGLRSSFEKGGALVYAREREGMADAVLVIPREELEKFGSAIQKLDLKLQRVPELKGTPGQILSSLKEKKGRLERELAETDEALARMSARYYPLLAGVEEQLAIEVRKLEVLNSLGFTDSSFVLEGWVPAERLAPLQKALAEHTGSKALVYRLKSKGRPPTLLKNPKRARFFESFIRFYSLPQSSEFDPTPIFALTFPVFFGLMLGDVGYAAVILAISVWILRRIHHPGRTVVPAKLRAFAGNIFRKSAFEKLAMAMIPGSIVGIVLGFLFNEYFGFKLNGPLFAYLSSSLGVSLPPGGAFLDPLQTLGLKTLLLISGYIGLFEVSLGLVIGAVNGYWMKEVRHSVGKVGWLSVAWGVALLGLTLLHRQSVSPTANPFAAAYVGAVVAGLAMIAYGEGAQALIELPSIISHIISYTRLVGILLASVVLAEVIDRVFLGTLSGGPFLLAFGVVILVFGQLFNIVLALSEPGIQGARLLYVEFFSKFFHGSGRPFVPFGGRRTYTLKEIEVPE